MTLDTLIMLAGAFVALLPFLGFPSSWDTALLFLVGILIVALGIVVRRERSENHKRPTEKIGGAFTENGPRGSAHEDA